ncbi:MAG: hypothetical protein L0Y62_03060 [Nitrospirae bacterium]|nr:hypothetical protein [Nitrospirota bacterium]
MSAEANMEKKFYPDYLVEIIFFVLIALELLIIIALLYPVSIGRQIDFTNQFQPRSEWYFLWLYQLVRYFPGKLALVGTIVMPISLTLLLLMIPYIDRGRYGRLNAAVVGASILLIFALLTIMALL